MFSSAILMFIHQSMAVKRYLQFLDISNGYSIFKAGQNFWGLSFQNPSKRLAQNMTVYNVNILPLSRRPKISNRGILGKQVSGFL